MAATAAGGRRREWNGGSRGGKRRRLPGRRIKERERRGRERERERENLSSGWGKKWGSRRLFIGGEGGEGRESDDDTARRRFGCKSAVPGVFVSSAGDRRLGCRWRLVAMLGRAGGATSCCGGETAGDGIDTAGGGGEAAARAGLTPAAVAVGAPRGPPGLAAARGSGWRKGRRGTVAASGCGGIGWCGGARGVFQRRRRRPLGRRRQVL